MTSAAPLQRLAATTTSRARGRQRLGDDEHAIVGQVAERELDIGRLERRARRGGRGAGCGSRRRGSSNGCRIGSIGVSRLGRRRGSGRAGSQRGRCSRAARSSSDHFTCRVVADLADELDVSSRCCRGSTNADGGPAACCFDPRNRRCGLPTTTITSASLPHGPPNQEAGRGSRPAEFRSKGADQTCVCSAPVAEDVPR